MKDLITVIDADDFEKAQNDPKVHKFLQESREYVDKLRREGRDHTMTNCKACDDGGSRHADKCEFNV